MSDCDECDFHGPELPGLVRDMRELHRATHAFGEVFVDAFKPLADWQMRVLERVMEARAKGLRIRLDLPRTTRRTRLR